MSHSYVRGTLDARAGVNYRLFGEARMVRPRSWTAEPRLRSVDEGLRFGASLIAAGATSRGLCAEFFAVAYTDYLAHRYDLPSRRELDDTGIVESSFALIERLGTDRG